MTQHLQIALNPVFVSESLGHLTASGIPETIDQFQLALNAAFAAGKVAGASPVQPSQVAEPDMFWNYDDAEKLYNSVDEFLNDEICNGNSLEIGDTRTIQCAIRLANFNIKITKINEEECEADYEVVDTAKNLLMPATGFTHKDGKIQAIDMSRLPKGA